MTGARAARPGSFRSVPPRRDCRAVRSASDEKKRARLAVISYKTPAPLSHCLVARDKRTGEVVGSVELPGSPIGTPMTYELDGRQYVAITVSGRPPELVAFALPEE